MCDAGDNLLQMNAPSRASGGRNHQPPHVQKHPIYISRVISKAEHEAHLHRWRPPQFIKCAPLSRELRKEHGKVMVHTGQDAHRNWKGAFKRRTWYGACVRRDKLNANRRAGSIQPCIKAGYVMAGVRSFDRMIPEETNRCNMEEAFLGMDGDINKDW